jgi:hypothetical protein
MMSVKTNPSRSNVSPIVIAISAENIGPAVTAVKLAIFAANRDGFGPIGRSNSVRRRLTGAG